jgi:hypothetical protein
MIVQAYFKRVSRKAGVCEDDYVERRVFVVDSRQLKADGLTDAVPVIRNEFVVVSRRHRGHLHEERGGGHGVIK